MPAAPHKKRAVLKSENEPNLFVGKGGKEQPLISQGARTCPFPSACKASALLLSAFTPSFVPFSRVPYPLFSLLPLLPPLLSLLLSFTISFVLSLHFFLFFLTKISCSAPLLPLSMCEW